MRRRKRLSSLRILLIDAGAPLPGERPMTKFLRLVALTLFAPVCAWGQSWTQRLVAGPSARTDGVMVYDSARNLTVLFGGNPTNGETWEWNGNAWTQRLVAGPSGRYQHAMAYDSVRGVTLLFGGFPTNNET